MLAIDRGSGFASDSSFRDLPSFLRPGDTLVLNNTKVFPARLFGVTDTGAQVELFLVREIEDSAWEALARPAKRLKKGKWIEFDEDFAAEVLDHPNEGRVRIALHAADIFDAINRVGRTPLPPYIKRDDDSSADRDRYQTVFAKNRGAIAAPTAGLHFTPEILEEIKSNGVNVAEITLHVGYGTFEPVRVDEIEQHRVSPERFEIGADAAETLNRTRTEGGRIVAVGTTVTRTLEHALSNSTVFEAGTGFADLTITPGYRFRAVDALLTNFHLPKSSLLVLVSTFTGHKLIMDAYRHAVDEAYRFYSYGDCCFIY